MATPGKLPSPSEGTRRARSRRRLARAVSSSTYRPGISRRPGTAWDFHRSVSSAFVDRRRRQSPRVSEGDNRILPSGDLLSSASACVSAWHPREAETRHLPPYPCLAPSPPPVTGRRWLRTFPHGKFEQGFLDEYGPAQVGLGPPFTGKRLHRLRLSQRHLRFTPHTPKSRCAAPRQESRVLGNIWPHAAVNVDARGLPR